MQADARADAHSDSVSRVSDEDKRLNRVTISSTDEDARSVESSRDIKSTVSEVRIVRDDIKLIQLSDP